MSLFLLCLCDWAEESVGLSVAGNLDKLHCSRRLESGEAGAGEHGAGRLILKIPHNTTETREDQLVLGISL